MFKTKKNDIIAISINPTKSKRVKYSRYYLAKVTKTDGHGLVLEAQKIGSDDKYSIGDNELAFFMHINDPEKQVLARKLAKLLEKEPAKNYYEKSQLIRDAILTTTP